MADISSLLQSPQAVANQLLIDQQNLITFLTGFIRRQSGTVYGGGIEAAQGIVGAMGTNAATVFEASQTLAGLINAVAPAYGLTPLGNVMPDGYNATPNDDGTVTVAYSAPSSSSSAGGSSSSSDGQPSSSSSGTDQKKVKAKSS